MERERLDYIDGLRGIAVLMVVVIHSSSYDFGTQPPHMSVFRIVFTLLASQGYEGVSLFLVLSGFCLALPAFRRQAAGRDDWFSLRHFAVRRCWRILPPYYAALLLSVLLAFAAGRPLTAVDVTAYPGILDIAAHAILIQNLTPYLQSINGPFWSLALEWQWYAAFPAVLYGMLRWPRLMLAACLALACAWHVLTHDAGFAFGQASTVLPGRLFEFACGVAVARVVTSAWKPPRRFSTVLWWVFAMPLWIALLPPVYAVLPLVLGPIQPLMGISFGALVLLGIHSPRVRWLLSLRPLTKLGLASYSVYLIHAPVIALIQPWFWSVFHQWLLVTLLGAGVGIVSGAGFYFAVEQHFARYPARLVGRVREGIEAASLAGKALDAPKT